MAQKKLTTDMLRYLSKLFAVLFVILLLASCEQLGIEVTTVKGNWQSDKFDNGSYITLQLLEDGSFYYYVMVTDTTCSKSIKGTWKNEEDSLFLYAQGKETEPLTIEKLSMNNMTLRDGQHYIIMTRKYKSANYTYDDKLREVLELKNGFLSLALQLFWFVIVIFLCYPMVCWLIELFKWIKNKCR